jgi:hypothetical protein
LQKRPHLELDTSRILDLASKHPKKPLNPNILIKNAHSPAMSQSEDKF